MKKTALILLLVSISCQGLEFTVNTTEDTLDVDQLDGLCLDINGNCSLRAAIMQTNAFATNDTIYLPRYTSYVLTQTNSGFDDQRFNDLDITGRLTLSIENPDVPIRTFEERPIISAQLINDRVFELSSGQQIRFLGIGIIHGNALGSLVNERKGGGIYVSDQVGFFELNKSYVALNQAHLGAGIYSEGKFGGNGLAIIDSDISYNITDFMGAPLLEAGGAGVYKTSGTFFMDSSSIHNNQAVSMGFLSEGLHFINLDSVTIFNSLIADNGAQFNGIESLLFGIRSRDVETMFVVNSNITGNRHLGIDFKGGVGNERLFISNTVLADNFSDNCGDLEGELLLGDVDNPAHIFSSDESCHLPPSANNVENADAKLNPLKGFSPVNNFQFFVSQAPMDDSPLIDQGSALNPLMNGWHAGACLRVDMRDVSRPQYGGFEVRCDIGSYEVTDVIFANGFEFID